MRSKKREIKIKFLNKKEKTIKEKFDLSFVCLESKKEIKSTFSNGVYTLNISKDLKSINIKRKKKSKNYLLKSEYTVLLSEKKEYIYRVSTIHNSVLKFIYRHLKFISISIGGLSILGGISIFSININNYTDPSVNWKLSVVENAGASYLCEYCNVIFQPDHYSKTGHFFATDIPYNYKIEFKNGAKLENIFIYDWSTGIKQTISLGRKNGRSAVGTYNLDCGKNCLLKVGLSIKGDKIINVNDPADAIPQLLANKSTIDNCEDNGKCYLGVFYDFTQTDDDIQRMNSEPKLSYGIIEIKTLNEKKYFYVYIQLKSINAITTENTTGESRNQYLILTEEEFRNKTLFYEFIKDDSDLIKQMKAECKIMQENDLEAGTYNACEYLGDGQDELFSTISNHLNEVKQKK